MSYEAWMEKVNAIIANLAGGMTSDDLPDWCYYDAYDSGCEPVEAASEALEAAGFPVELLPEL